MLADMEPALARVGVPWELVSDEYYFNWNAEAIEAITARIATRFRMDTVFPLVPR